MDQLQDIINTNNQISLEELRALLTPDFVHECLKSSGITSTSDLVDFIITKASKLFAVLVLIERVDSLTTLVESGWDDGVWPLSEAEIPQFDDIQKRQEFIEKQWLIPPVFTKERHMELPGDAPLPLRKEYIGNGSFGVVWKVKFFPGHFQTTDKEHVAMKTIRSNNWGRIMRELETLRNRKHPNIVPLLGSFTINAFRSEERSLNLLFPLADMNMTQWLKLDSSPLGNDIDMRTWLYSEIYALVSAVAFLHREINGMVTSHHDLKPDNILWLDGSLKICDLGRSHLLPVADGSETDGQAGLGTFTYQPPEYYNDDGTRSSQKHGRAFDVWSLGCILTEMATLIVYGWEGNKIQEFAEARSSLGVNNSRRRPRDFSKTRSVDDSFHNNPDIVRQWLSALRKNESQILNESLNIVEKMLVNNPDERLYSWEVELSFFDLLHHPGLRASRLEKMKMIAQPPKPGLPSLANYPLQRAIEAGDKDRIDLLSALGWPNHAPDSLSAQCSDTDGKILSKNSNSTFSPGTSAHGERNTVLYVPQRDGRMTLRQKPPRKLSSVKAIRL